MTRSDKFVAAVKSEFPDDRLTWQKAVPTFHPESSDDAASFFKLANRMKQQIFITGFGNNIDPEGEPFVDMVSVRTDRLNNMLKIAAEDFYITTGSGYPLLEINKQLAEHKLWLPHSSLPYVGSVGGSIAAGLSAELDGHDFPLKKYFIRAEIVTPEGDIITPGSTCFKSVSGYDIVKIFAGSWGLLGLIVSATFRVMPDSAADEFNAMRMKSFDRENFLEGLREENCNADVAYSRKIKIKFDPTHILPIV
ncbi:MAG: FAD-binding oxidoreductase [candidate division Zixibacteria bacterium]|nr:FAD-binding oxidoreductase [candidate division Zixibacteria bacterium]